MVFPETLEKMKGFPELNNVFWNILEIMEIDVFICLAQKPTLFMFRLDDQ